jgi:hypothetical protein
MKQKGIAAIIAAFALVAGIAITIVPAAFASAVDDQKDQRCLPRSEFNGKDNSGNEHFNADGSFSQDKNPHDGDTPKGNPHDRCVGS